MKRKLSVIFLSVLMVLSIGANSNESKHAGFELNQRARAGNSQINSVSPIRRSYPQTFIFNYTRSFMWKGCLVTATFSVSITVDIAREEVLAVSGSLISSSVDCGTPVYESGTLSVSHNGRYITSTQFSSSNQMLEDALNSIEGDIVDDINYDIDNLFD